MTDLGSNLLKSDNFPIEKDSNIHKLLKRVRGGTISVALSSFDEIFNMTPEGQPFPIGAVSFEDGKNRFVISWVEEFSKINITGIEDYSLRLRNYPVVDYPVLSLLVGLHNGKVDPENNAPLWYYKESLLDLSLMLTRIKIHQLLNCEEVLFCLFDGTVENLSSYGFTLDKSDLKEMLLEVEAASFMLKTLDLTNHVRMFTTASHVVKSCFNQDGLPISREALNIYLKRKELCPKPSEHNWKEFLSI